MKKLVLASALAGVSTLSFAQSGLYVQGDVGYSKLQYAPEDMHLKLRDNGVKATIAVGKDMGDLRYQVDVTRYNDASGRLVDPNGGKNVTVEYTIPNGQGGVESGTAEGRLPRKDLNMSAVQSVGVSAIYDFETTNPMITPYAGARLAMNRIKARTTTYTSAVVELPDPNNEGQTMSQLVVDQDTKTKTKDKLGLGATAGVQFNLTNQIAIDTGVEYNHLGKVDGIKGDQFGAKAGVRVNF